jgi:hypothetical protein
VFTGALCTSVEGTFLATDARGRLRVALALLRHGTKATNEVLEMLACRVLPFTFDMAGEIHPDCCDDTTLQRSIHSALTTFVYTTCHR